MAKLYFCFSSMNAGKSTNLLQVAHNYGEQDMETYLLTSAFDDRSGSTGKIVSRIGIEKDAQTYQADTDLYAKLSNEVVAGTAAVLIDEAQWLSDAQVWQLARFVDVQKVPVMCYGIRTDFQGKLFPGSKALLAIADELREIRTICHCGRKATMVLRLNEKGAVEKEGSQVQVGGNESYKSVCRRHWLEAMGEL
ncbi:MAG: thymidine kinase [Candidatus Paceibacteria bacterium]|jgi:thymidine kinase